MAQPGLSVGEMLKFTWRRIRAYPGTAALIWIASALATAIALHVVNIVFEAESAKSAGNVAVLVWLIPQHIVQLLIQAPVALVATKASLKICDDERLTRRDIAILPALYLSFVATCVIGALVNDVGLLLLLLPGLIGPVLEMLFLVCVVVRLAFASLAVVDRGLNPIAAIRASIALTSGKTLKLALLLLVIVIPALLATFLIRREVGWFLALATTPFMYIAFAHAYRIASAAVEPELAAPTR